MNGYLNTLSQDIFSFAVGLNQPATLVFLDVIGAS